MSIFENPIVFINYRRADSLNDARSLNNDLENAFGEGFVFQDLEDITAGTRWIDKLLEAGSRAKVILAVIGPDWLQINNEGISRLSNPEDWVRKELELAIQQDKVIVPVLVNGGKLPDKSEISQSLHTIFEHQTFELRSDKWNIDLQALIKDISKISETKTLKEIELEKEVLSKNAKEKGFRKKIMWMTMGIVGLVTLFLAFIFLSPESGKLKDTNSGRPILDLADTSGIQPGITTNQNMAFCPDFINNAEIKTLLYPISVVGQGQFNIGTIVKQNISDICLKHGILSEVKTPNIKDDKFFDAHDARGKCVTCTSDIFITGICYAESSDKYGLKANIGFCDPVFQGFGLDADKLNITISNSSIGDLISDPNILESFEYVLEIYLGIFKIKNGDVAEGAKIIQNAIKTYPKLKDIELIARDVLWQAEYKLGKNDATIKTLDAMYQLDNSKITPLILKANINFKAQRYNEAILDLNTVIDKENNKAAKDKFIERRGDSYYEAKQYDKAKSDYQIITTKPMNTKIRKTNAIIIENDSQIRNLEAASTLTDIQKSNLVNLHVQNGNLTKASTVLNTIDLSQYNTPTNLQKLNLQNSTIEVLQLSNVALAPAVKRNLNLRLNNGAVINH